MSCEQFSIELYSQRVTLEGMILKPNMVLPGLSLPSSNIRYLKRELANSNIR
jgi:fructose-bisphosphate aldolase class 1